MGKWVEIFKCVISHSSSKSLIPTLHKFTIRNLDLFFPFFGKLNSLNSVVYLLTCRYFGTMEKKFVPSESRVAFCRLFIVRVKKVCYEKESPRVTSRMFFTLYTGVSPPICSYCSLRNEVECQCYNETNIPPC